MEKWELSLAKFMETWPYVDITVGLLACGSYITGNPSVNSDLDVHIILSEDVDFRERGNKYVDGLLIEYFANPPRQIIKYMEDDFIDYSRMAMVQFLTGKIVSDPHGIVVNLQEIAQRWFDKPFPPIEQSVIEYYKYGWWDLCDNLEDLHKSNSMNFAITFYNYLTRVVDFYRKFLGYGEIRPMRMLDVFTSESVRKKYLLPEFPDQTFSKIVVVALQSESNADRMAAFQQIIEYMFEKFGGFTIDGWKNRTDLDL